MAAQAAQSAASATLRRAASRCTPSSPRNARRSCDLFVAWSDIDGGYRTLAHRSAYENLVWVSPSTLYRTLVGEGLVLPARAQRTAGPPSEPLGDCIVWKRHQMWIYDITHVPPCRPRRLRHLGRRHRQMARLPHQRRRVRHTSRSPCSPTRSTPMACGNASTPATPTIDGDEPILLIMSDVGPQVRAVTSREFWAPCSIAARFGRRGTGRADQAWIETLFGHIKTEWPHLEHITDPHVLRTRTRRGPRRLQRSAPARLPRLRHRRRRTRRLAATQSARPAETASTEPAGCASPTIASTNPSNHDRAPTALRNPTAQNGHLLRSTSRLQSPSRRRTRPRPAAAG